jgi:NTP pyrophosphatase (non-canonical NTP hydrolase)
MRPAGAAFRDGEVEPAQVRAAQVIRQVGCGKPQEFGHELHRANDNGRFRHGILAEVSEGHVMSEALRALQQRLAAFAAAREWEQFHSPKNLAMALAVEAAELVEEFQWLTEAQSESLDAERRDRVRLELADVFIYLLRLADRLDVDLLRAADDKMALNERKYPAERVRGDARKYTDYD